MATEQTQTSQRHYKYFVVRDIKKVKDSKGNEVLSVPIQSLQADREGDVVNEECQQDIIKQLQTGKVPAFPNHGMGDSLVMYDFREIMGKWVGGEVNGNTTYGYLQLRKNNASAEALMDLIEQDMPVGFSIGFFPKEYEEKENGMEFSALDLLEVSPVGIPSNAVAVNGNNVDMINAVTQAIETDGSADAVKAKIKQFIGGNMTEKSNEQEKETPEGSELENKVSEEETKENKSDTEQPEQPESEDTKSDDTKEPENTETKESDEEKPCPDDEEDDEYKQFKKEVMGKITSLENKVQKLEESLNDKSKSVKTKSEVEETQETETDTDTGDEDNTNDMEEQGKEEYENGNEELDTATTGETEETGETEGDKSTEPKSGKAKGKKIKTIDETNTQEEQSIQPEEPKVRGFRFRY